MSAIPTEPRVLLFFCNVGWFFISHRLALAKAAKARGYQVHVACDIDNPEEARVITGAGLEFHHVPLNRGGLNPIGDLRTFFSLLRILMRCRPTLVHNITIKAVLYGSIAARLLGIPGVVNAVSGLGYVFVDEGRAGVLRLLVRRLYRFALRPRKVRVIFQNEEDRRLFIQSGLVDDSKAVLIAGAGVDLASYAATPEPAAPPVRIVLPARMLRDKGVNEFAAAARLLRQRGFSVECLLVGGLDNSNPAALSAADLRALEASRAVKWLGHVADMPRLLANSHIICLPSYREGLPKALIEACAAGRPIVTTSVPGCRDVVTDGVNGLLVPPRDAAALAHALGRLVEDAQLRVAMGQQGREIAKRFDLSTVIRSTFQVYDELAKSAARG